jgi:hypothetical protein
MIKPLALTILCLFITISSLLAQTTHRDSVVRIAQEDAKNFKLSSADKERFKQDKDNYSSDLFKPTDRIASDNKLLQDSVYVKAFRAAAYSKVRNKRTAGHYVLLGVGGYVVISAVAVLVILGVLISGSK